MNRLISVVTTILLLVSAQAGAVQQTFEYHSDARMRLENGDPLERAYGYVQVLTDKKGHGVIRVMFSNGTPIDGARFNAQVNFLDGDGKLLRSEEFSRRVGAANPDGAAEQFVAKLVDLDEFASLQVDFFLTEVR